MLSTTLLVAPAALALSPSLGGLTHAVQPGVSRIALDAPTMLQGQSSSVVVARGNSLHSCLLNQLK